jgi:hypothetical protein
MTFNLGIILTDIPQDAQDEILGCWRIVADFWEIRATLRFPGRPGGEVPHIYGAQLGPLNDEIIFFWREKTWHVELPWYRANKTSKP